VLLLTAPSPARGQTIGRPPAGSTAGDALYDLLLQGVAGSSNQAAGFQAIFRDQLMTFPLASSAGGFSWTFDPTLGVLVRHSRSFGPMFAERPLTSGRRKANVSVAYQRTRFDSISGQPLRALATGTDGSNFTARSTTALDLTTENTILTVSYGLASRVDVGLVLPFGRTTVEGTSTNFIRSPVTGVTFEDSTYVVDSSSSGVADITLRGKVWFLATPPLDLGASVDLRLPLGDDQWRDKPDGRPYEGCVGNGCSHQTAGNKLLGVGHTQTKILLLGAVKAGRFSPHFNVGYTFGGSGPHFEPIIFEGYVDLNRSQPPNEINYTAGVDVAVSDRLTIAADMVGRTLRDSIKLDYGTRLAGNPPQPFTGFVVASRNVRLLLGAVSGKVNIGGLWLINGSVLFALNDEGVSPGVTPVIGLERAF